MFKMKQKSLTGMLLLSIFIILVSCDSPEQTTIPLTPDAPASLTATAVDSGAVITWNLSDRAESYVIYLSTDEFGTYKAYLTTSEVSAKLTNLENGKQYWIKVAARNTYGRGGSSSTVTVTPAKPLSAPDATSIKSVVVYDTSVSVSWTLVPSAESYDVYLSKNSAEYIFYATTAATDIKIIDIVHNDNYSVAVVAKNSIGESAKSDLFNFTPLILPPPNLPPTQIIAYPSSNTVSLFWQKIDNATSYAVYISDSDAGEYKPVGTTTNSYFTVNNLENEKQYFFKIRSVNFSGVSNLSVAVSATPTSVITALARPINIRATSEDRSIKLQWNEVLFASGYNIYFSTSEFTDFKKLGSSATASYTTSEVENDTVYYFYITAYRLNLEGTKSITVESVARQMTTTPLAVTALNASSGDTIIYLTWSPSVGAGYYKVMQSSDNATWKNIATVINPAYLDKSLLNDRKYYYQVIAGNSYGESEPSTVSSTAIQQLTPPTLVTGIEIKNFSDYFKLSWDKNPTASYYKIYIKKSSDSSFVYLKSTLDNFTVIDKLESGVSYDIYVTGSYANKESEKSVIVSSTFFSLVTAPIKPENLTAVTADNILTLTWSASDYAQYYIVQIAKNDADFIPTLSTNNTYCTINFLANDSYKVNIVAANTVNDRANEDNITTRSSEPSDSVPFVIKDPEKAPPTIATLSAIAGDNSTYLTWSAASQATSYNVYFSTTNESTGFLIDDNATTANTYTTVKNLLPNQQYFFYVEAVNAKGSSEQSTTVSATPYSVVLPQALAGIQYHALDNQTYFTWLPTTYAKNYKVERKLSTEINYTVLATVEMTQFFDFNLINGTRYDYKVTPMNDFGAGDNASFSLTPSIDKSKPQPPSYLKAAPGSTSVLLEYGKVENASSYKIHKRRKDSLPGTAFTYIGTTINRVYTVTGLTNGVTYEFSIRATNSNGDSAYSTPAVATPSAASTLPTPPINLTASQIATTNNIQLNWTNNRSDLINLIYFNIPAFKEDFILYAVVTGSQYLFTNATVGTLYTFAIRPVLNGNIGAFSDNVSITPTVP